MGVRPRNRVLLLRRLGVERPDRALEGAQGAHRLRDMELAGVDVAAAPEELEVLVEVLLPRVAQRLRLRPELRQRLVELNRLRRERLQFGLLGGGEEIGRADDRAEHQRQEQRDEAHDRADHVARLFHRMLFRQQLLQIEPEGPAQERYDCDDDANPDRCPWRFPPKMTADDQPRMKPALVREPAVFARDRLFGFPRAVHRRLYCKCRMSSVFSPPPAPERRGQAEFGAV